MKITASTLDNFSKEEKSNIISRIKYLRKNLFGLTQKDFARKLKVTQSYISMLEAGEKPLTMSVVEKLIYDQNVNPKWLLYGSSEKCFSNKGSKKTEAEEFIDWYNSLPAYEQIQLAKTVRELSDVLKNYPPGS